MQPAINETGQNLDVLCGMVRQLAEKGEYRQGERLAAIAMSNFPHAPEPHNLMGILLEREGDHVSAMKHFRAAWALNPAYIPARYNLDRYGTFYTAGSCAFDISDCPDADNDRK